MGQYGPSIKDRFRKVDSIYHPLKRKKKMLERFVRHFTRYKFGDNQTIPRARRARQIERGQLRAENGLVMS